MDIQKTKAEFEQSECFKRFEHVVQYTFFEFGAYIKRTDVPDDIEKKCGKLITALIFSWSAWKEAKANTVPDGYRLVKNPKPLIGNKKVDFSQAPEWANFWLKDGYSKRCVWSKKRPKLDLDIGCFVFPYDHQAIEAPDFGFDGDWTKSLTSRKAMVA